MNLYYLQKNKRTSKNNRRFLTLVDMAPASIVNALSNLKPMWATTREIGGIIYEGNLNKGKK